MATEQGGGGALCRIQQTLGHLSPTATGCACHTQRPTLSRAHARARWVKTCASASTGQVLQYDQQEQQQKQQGTASQPSN